MMTEDSSLKEEAEKNKRSLRSADPGRPKRNTTSAAPVSTPHRESASRKTRTASTPKARAKVEVETSRSRSAGRRRATAVAPSSSSEDEQDKQQDKSTSRRSVRKTPQRRSAAKRHTPPPPLADKTPRSAKSKSAAAGKTSRQHGKRGKSGRRGADDADSDPFDIDGAFNDTPQINVNFKAGDLRFAAANTPTHGNVAASRYANLEKRAEERRVHMNDTLPLDDDSDLSISPQPLYRIVTEERSVIEQLSPGRSTVLKRASLSAKVKKTETRALTPAQRRRLSAKQTPSTGEMADMSASLVTNKSSSGSYPRSTPSSARRSTSSGSKSLTQLRNSIAPTSRESGRIATGSLSLFSDVATDDDDAHRVSGDIDAADDQPSATLDVARRARKRGRPSAADAAAQPTPRKRKAGGSSELDAVPKRRLTADISVPQLTVNEQHTVDHPPADSHGFLPGARVMAKWLDKNFYPAQVLSNDGMGFYKVKYIQDGAVKSRPSPDLLPLSRLIQGCTLMVEATVDGETELQPVDIQTGPNPMDTNEWYNGIFHVYNQTTESAEKVAWTKLVIDAAQTKAYVSSQVNTAAQNVTVDNISEGRGSRRSRPTSFTPVPTVVRRTPVSQRKPIRLTPNTTTPTTGRGRGRPPASAVLSDSKSSATSDAASDAAHSEVEQMFSGYKFVLTSANRRITKDSSSDDDERPIVPFNKKVVRTMIEDRGGQVVDDFQHMLNTQGVVLIADTHYRTHKYLSALARAIPCVTHVWIHECVQSKKFLPYKNYMLPAGISLETGRLVEWHDECPTLLKNVVVMVHTENRPQNPGALDFVQIWAPLVRCMGATLATAIPQSGSVDILLTDGSCPDALLERARARNAAAVSSEWLIQAIITGRRPQPDSHQKYEYDFVEHVAASSAPSR